MSFDVEKLNSIPIVEVCNLLDIQLNRSKKALCFFHQEKTPSFSINTSKNIWKCFGCGESGNVITLVEKRLNLSFLDACFWLTKNFYSNDINNNISINKKIKIKKLSKIENSTYQIDSEVADCLKTIIESNSLSKKGEEYLCIQRQINKNTILKHQIFSIDNINIFYSYLRNNFDEKILIKCGFYSEQEGKLNKVWNNAGVVFPFENYNKKIVTLQLRSYNSVCKYIFLKGLSKCLFNESILSNLQKESTVFICEGVPDALSLIDLGYNSVALPGVSSYQNIEVKMFENYKNIIIFDNDESGIEAARKLSIIFNKNFIDNKIFEIKGFKDINEMLKDLRGKK